MTANLGDARKRAWAPRRPWTEARRAKAAAGMKPRLWTKAQREAQSEAMKRQWADGLRRPMVWTPAIRAAHKAALDRRYAGSWKRGRTMAEEGCYLPILGSVGIWVYQIRSRSKAGDENAVVG